MRITRVTLNNFRSYPVAEVELGDGVNVFTGSNAQGKTNLLEAIYLTAVGRSMRTPRDRELIKWGESRARVRVEAEGETGKRKVEIVISDKENKRVAVGGAQVTRLGELMGVINVVLFSPDETAIIKNGPSERRRFARYCYLSDFARVFLSFVAIQQNARPAQQTDKKPRRRRHVGRVGRSTCPSGG